MSEKFYKIDTTWDVDILRITISGNATKQNATKIAKRVFEIEEEYSPSKVLIDCRSIMGRLNVVETYYHVGEYPTKPTYVIKSAILENAENEYYYTFHETVAANIGFGMKYFTDIDKALAWLNE